MPQPTVATWKKRGTTPNAATVSKLAAYFNVSVDYLLGTEGLSFDDLLQKEEDGELTRNQVNASLTADHENFHKAAVASRYESRLRHLHNAAAQLAIDEIDRLIDIARVLPNKKTPTNSKDTPTNED